MADILDYPDVISAAGEIAAVLNGRRREAVSLSNGIVLRLRDVPPYALQNAATKFPPPTIPVVYIEDKGREEENPLDPDYLKALQTHSVKQLELAVDVLLLLGTSLLTKPEGEEGPEDNEWHERLTELGLEVNVANKSQRYLSWLRMYALARDDDMSEVVSAVIGRAGVSEVAVANAILAFRRAA